MVSVGIPHHDSHVECDRAGALLCCILLTVFSKQMTANDTIAQRGSSTEQQVLLMQTSCERGHLGVGCVGTGTAAGCPPGFPRLSDGDCCPTV